MSWWRRAPESTLSRRDPERGSLAPMTGSWSAHRAHRVFQVDGVFGRGAEPALPVVVGLQVGQNARDEVVFRFAIDLDELAGHP